MDILNGLMNNYIENNTIVKYLSLFALSIIVLLVCLIAYYIAKKIVSIVIKKYVVQSKSRLDDILYEKKFYERMAHTVPIIVLYLVQPAFNEYSSLVDKIAGTYLIIIIILLVDSALNSVDDLYKQYEISKTRPITAVLQVVKVVVYILGVFLILANLMGESPIALLGGMGALSAVFSLVFKDPILGFVGGIQLTSTDMLRVGDWIYVPKYNAEGTVTEIALTTIRLQAADKTTITVPNYSLITDSFVNYRGMQDEGGRRIKRKFYIDINSIKLYTKEHIEELKKIDYLSKYISDKESMDDGLNSSLELEDDVKGLTLSNIEVFRLMAQNYIENHPKLRKDMTLMVRQLEQEERGMPIEVQAFTDTTEWVKYEVIQGEVFDHVYVLAGELGLKLFQNPSGSDMQERIPTQE